MCHLMRHVRYNRLGGKVIRYMTAAASESSSSIVINHMLPVYDTWSVKEQPQSPAKPNLEVLSRKRQ